MKNSILVDSKTDAIIILTSKNIFYMSGLLLEDSALIVLKDKIAVITDKRYYSEIDNECVTDKILNEGNLFKTISEYIDKLNIIDLGFEGEITFNDYISLKKFLKDKNLINISNFIMDSRSIKSENEISLMKKAYKINEKSLNELIPFIKTGVSERELAYTLDRIMVENGADSPAFNTIVAFKENSAIPHHMSGERKLCFGDNILIDFGAKFKGYCSDMTRTFAFGNVSNKLAKIYDIVYNANRIGIEKIKSGISSEFVHDCVYKYIASKGYGNFFTHSTGHGVGLNIHELPKIGKNSSAILKVGNVITIEPGIYLENDFGVRIEDMILVGKDGCYNFAEYDKKLIVL